MNNFISNLLICKSFGDSNLLCLLIFFFGKSIGFAKWMTKLTIRCKSLTCHDVKVFQLQKKHIALLQKRFHRLAQSQVHVRIYVISTVYKFLFSAFFSVPSFDILFFISIFNHAHIFQHFFFLLCQSVNHYSSLLVNFVSLRNCPRVTLLSATFGM